MKSKVAVVLSVAAPTAVVSSCGSANRKYPLQLSSREKRLLSSSIPASAGNFGGVVSGQQSTLSIEFSSVRSEGRKRRGEGE